VKTIARRLPALATYIALYRRGFNNLLIVI